MWGYNFLSKNGKRCVNCRHHGSIKTKDGCVMDICTRDMSYMPHVQREYHTCMFWKKRKKESRDGQTGICKMGNGT